LEPIRNRAANRVAWESVGVYIVETENSEMIFDGFEKY